MIKEVEKEVVLAIKAGIEGKVKEKRIGDGAQEKVIADTTKKMKRNEGEEEGEEKKTKEETGDDD